MELYLSIIVSAGVGTAIVEILFKLVVSHLLDRKMYEFKLTKADRRECANEIIKIINISVEEKMINSGLDFSNRANVVSDRLEVLTEKEASVVLDKYTARIIHANGLLKQLFSLECETETAADYLETQHEVYTLREELVKIARKLKGIK